MKYSLEVKNLTKVIGKDMIIDDVSFSLEKGKIYGLVGANGSGKSTLLKIILGLYKCKGEIVINGKNLRTNYSECLNDIGGIVDFVSFYDYLTAYENLRYFALLYDVSISRIEEVAFLVGLDLESKKCVKRFSLGMKQRLGIAIALLKNPSILVLDEPTNGLDPKGILDLRNLLLSFKDKTIIISSHLISEIEKVVDDVLFINNKKIYHKCICKGRGSVKFRLGDYKKAASVLKIPELNEHKSVYMSDDEISSNIKKLTDSDVPVYRVQDESSLEEMLISMIEGDNHD